MNTALLVLRITPGLVLMGHGLQKLVPPGYSPPLFTRPVIAARGGLREPRHPAGCGGRRPGGLGRARRRILARSGAPHAGRHRSRRRGDDHRDPQGACLERDLGCRGGFEFPLVLLTVGFAITALGLGSLSVDSWLGIDNWAGINWTINPAARSAIALAVGLAGGLAVALASRASKRTATHANPHAAR